MLVLGIWTETLTLDKYFTNGLSPHDQLFNTLGVKICLAIAGDGWSRLVWNTVFQAKCDCCHLNQSSYYCPLTTLTWDPSHFFYIIQMVLIGPRIYGRWKIGWRGAEIPSLQLWEVSTDARPLGNTAILGLLCAPVSPGKLTGSPNQTRVKWPLVCFWCFFLGGKRLVFFSPGSVTATQMIQRCKRLTRQLLLVHIIPGKRWKEWLLQHCVAYAWGVTRDWALWVALPNT